MSTDASSFGSVGGAPAALSGAECSDRAVPITVPHAADVRRLEPPDQWPPARPLVTLEDRMDVASRCRADRMTARTAEFILLRRRRS